MTKANRPFAKIIIADRAYLRVCAIYRLLKAGKIDKATAIEMGKRPVRGGGRREITGTIEMWLAGPLKSVAQ
jgi:hypothetical protein